MSDAVHAHGQQAGIGQHHLVEIARGGIAVERRPAVAQQQSRISGQSAQKHLVSSRAAAHSRRRRSATDSRSRP